MRLCSESYRESLPLGVKDNVCIKTSRHCYMFNIFAVADTMQRVNKGNIQLSSLYVILSFYLERVITVRVNILS